MVDKLSEIICVPGDRLCMADEKTIPAAGTYKSEDYIYASLAGRVVVNTANKDVKFIGVEGNNKTTSRTMPSLNDIVTCRVTSIQANVALCLIWCVNTHVLKQPFKALVRKPELLEANKSCLPGDIIVGKVIGVGDNGRYELGQVYTEDSASLFRV